MSIPSNTLVIEDLSQYIIVAEEWDKWLKAGNKENWRTFLNAWRKKGYIKNKYVYWREGEISPETGEYYWYVEVFEKQQGLKYRDRCPDCATCETCKGKRFVWLVNKITDTTTTNIQ